jgi:hypothetical protein
MYARLRRDLGSSVLSVLSPSAQFQRPAPDNGDPPSYG